MTRRAHHRADGNYLVTGRILGVQSEHPNDQRPDDCLLGEESALIATGVQLVGDFAGEADFITVIEIVDAGDTWVARAEGIGEVRVKDAQCATLQLDELLPGDACSKLPEREMYIDATGQTVWPIRLFFAPQGGREMHSVYAEIAADPPPHCHFLPQSPNEGVPASLACVVPAPTRLAAIERVVRDVRTRYSVTTELNYLDVMECESWSWPPDTPDLATVATDGVAQLILTAAHHAELAGLAPAEMIRFMHTALGHAPSGGAALDSGS